MCPFSHESMPSTYTSVFHCSSCAFHLQYIWGADGFCTEYILPVLLVQAHMVIALTPKFLPQSEISKHISLNCHATSLSIFILELTCILIKRMFKSNTFHNRNYIMYIIYIYISISVNKYCFPDHNIYNKKMYNMSSHSHDQSQTLCPSILQHLD